MKSWEIEFLRCYPELQSILVCDSCGRSGTIYNYMSAVVTEPLLGEDGVQLTDKKGNPRTVERRFLECRFCKGSKQTKHCRGD